MPEHDNDFEFPANSHHTTIIGRTGSGKTQCGAWLLSHADFHEMPYIIIDYKGDDLLNSIGAQPASIYDEPPARPGLYIAKVMPHEEEEMNDYLWKIHARGETGLYFDEGFMVAKLKALEAILMQGRSKKIPCFILSQRPSWMSRYAFSEASHFVVFHLNDRRDQMKVKEFFRNYNEGRLPEYHAQWYNVNDDKNSLLQPVPSSDKIRVRFETRLSDLRDTRNKKHFI